MIRIGVDLGGTKIEAIALDTQGHALCRSRIATPKSYEAALSAITNLVKQTESVSARCMGVGIGHPGSFSPETGLLRGANSTWLNGRDFRNDLMNALARPTRFANDADCFALSESLDGAGAGHNCVFGVILGTGVGGGIIEGGRLVSGPQNIAGEWGHTCLPWMNPEEHPGPACWCGQRGCVESWLSGPAIAADYIARTGRDLLPEHILEQTGELEHYAERLARALSTVINILDPDIIVLGGGVSNTPNLPETVETALPAFVFSDVIRTRIVRHQHGDSSGVRGAAMLWPARTS